MPELPYSYPESKNDELTEAEKGVYIEEWLKIITRIATNEKNYKAASKSRTSWHPGRFKELRTDNDKYGKDYENYRGEGENRVIRADYNFIVGEKLVAIKLRSETHSDIAIATSTSQAESLVPVVSIEISGRNGEHESIDIYYKSANQIEYFCSPSGDGIKKAFTAETAQRIAKLLEDVSFAEPVTAGQAEYFMKNRLNKR